nr:MAG TPA: hypothetical protein [Caudoviricetes sp.]
MQRLMEIKNRLEVIEEALNEQYPHFLSINGGKSNATANGNKKSAGSNRGSA